MVVTHMPWKLAVITALVIAAALGAYYVFIRVVGVNRDWRATQGTVEARTEPEGGREYCALRVPGGRAGEWFRYRWPKDSAAPQPEAGQELVMTFWARTRTGVSTRVTLWDRDGAVFQQPLQVKPTDDWVLVHLPLAGFVATKGKESVDPSRLRPEAGFELVGAGEVSLDVTAPRLHREISQK